MYIHHVFLTRFTREYLLTGRNFTGLVEYEELLHQLAIRVLELQDSDSLEKDISDVVNFEIELAKVCPFLSVCLSVSPPLCFL